MAAADGIGDGRHGGPERAAAFQMRAIDDGPARLVECAGELDASVASGLARVADEMPQTVRSLHLDCARVSFVDSYGVNAILEVASSCAARGISFSVEPSRQMRKILEILGLGDRLTLLNQGGGLAS